MLKFTIDEQKCTKCGFCVNDCPAGIIDMNTVYPAIATKQEAACFKCQHCLAVCPTGAISILGKNPENSQPLKGNLPRTDSKPLLRAVVRCASIAMRISLRN